MNNLAFVELPLEYDVQFLSSDAWKAIDKLERMLRRAMRMNLQGSMKEDRMAILSLAVAREIKWRMNR